MQSVELTHSLADLGLSFRLGMSQWMGYPGAAKQVDCAVDHVRIFEMCSSPTAIVEENISVGCPGQATTFHANFAVGDGAIVTWRRDGNALPNDARYHISSDGQSSALEIDPVTEDDTGNYTVIVNGTCGFVESDAQGYLVFPSGSGDVNNDGFVDGRDIQLFTELMTQGGLLNAGYCAGDMNGSGFIDLPDIAPIVTLLLQ